MPIECPIQFPRLERDAFRKLDYDLMKHAFETHRVLGRSCDEAIYQQNLAAMLDDAGLGPSSVEVLIRVRHGSFLKEYRIDLVAAGKAIYELKSTKEIVSAHEGQSMNYLLLADCEHGKVINFGGASLESRFVNNPISRDERYRFEWQTSQWKGPNQLRDVFLAFIEDIGLFLEAPLYNQFLVHHYGGFEHAVMRRSLSLDGRPLGKQAFQMCGPDEAFRVTTLSRNIRAQRTSLQTLVSLSDLKALHWINLNHHQIEIMTLEP
jgi:GxxExxY protein